MVTLERESHYLLRTDCCPHPCLSQAGWGSGEPRGLKESCPLEGTAGGIRGICQSNATKGEWSTVSKRLHFVPRSSKVESHHI